MRVVLVTGASAGIGLAIARYLTGKGCRVYGTSRKQAADGSPFTWLPMDVTDAGSVHSAVREIIHREGRIDVLINNAGIGFNGSVEDVSTEEINRVFATNVTGLLEVTRAVLPPMREAGRGLIINVSSVAGRFGLPFRGVYCASKHAVEAFSEALSLEVKAFGIVVCIVEPGDFKTSINENRQVSARALQGPYAVNFQRINQQVIDEVAHAQDPELMGQTIWRIMTTKNTRMRYVVAPFMQRLSIRLHQLLPGRSFEKLLQNHYKL